MSDSGKVDYIMKLVPLGDRVVIKALVAEETTKSGIVLPGQAKEKPSQAEVVAVGPGANNSIKSSSSISLSSFCISVSIM